MTSNNYLTQILGIPINNILCISLEECVLRREQILVQARKFGLEIEFVIVKRNPVPHRGCAESHLKCIQIAKDRNLDFICILEDDCLFVDDRMENAFKSEPISIPSGWEIVFLGYNALRAYPVASHLMKLIISFAAHAYIVHSRIYDEILDGYRSQWYNIPEMYDIEQYDHDLLYGKEIIDVFYAKYICHRRGQCYGIYPILATQSPNESSITGAFVDYTKILELHSSRFINSPKPNPEFSFLNPYSMKDLIDLPFGNDEKIQLPTFAKKVKIDIGLSINAPNSHLWIRESPNDLLVFGFEPNMDAVKQIKGQKECENKWTYSLSSNLVGDRCFISGCALGNETRMVKLYITEPDSGASSLYKPKMKVKNVEHVPQFRLENFFDLFPFDKVSIIEHIKINTQGSDFNILLGAGTYLMERVIYVTCNPESSTNKASDMLNIINYLAANGFSIVRHPNCVNPTFVNTRFLTEAATTYICQIS